MPATRGPDGLDRIDGVENLDDDVIDAALLSLLGTDPPPYVMAFDESGLGVPVPPGVPVEVDHVISGVPTALELCLPGDLPKIIDGWTRARSRRAAQATVHLRRDPDKNVILHFIDARFAFGVYLGIFVGAEGPFDSSLPKPELFRPRACTLKRDETSVVRSIDAAVTHVLGWSEDQLVGKATIEITHPDDKALGIAKWMEMLRRPGFDQRLVIRLRHRLGHYIWFEVTNRNLLSDLEHGCVLTELVDISEKMEAAEALRSREELLRGLTEALPLGIAQTDNEHRILYSNERLGSILARVNAATLREQFEHVVAADQIRFDAAVSAVVNRAETVEVELAVDHPMGLRRCSVSMRPFHAASGAVSGTILCVADVTQRVQLQTELERRARFDTLTHCHNRYSILEILGESMQLPGRENAGIAIVFIDLNGLKVVNDRYGHAAGDELLRLTGLRLLASVRAGDSVGRLGGDEFLVVCPDLATPAAAVEVANRLEIALAPQARFGSITIVPASSIGVAWTNCRINMDEMIADADEAMYKAKRERNGPILGRIDWGIVSSSS